MVSAGPFCWLPIGSSHDTSISRASHFMIRFKLVLLALALHTPLGRLAWVPGPGYMPVCLPEPYLVPAPELMSHARGLPSLVPVHNSFWLGGWTVCIPVSVLAAAVLV